MATRRDLFRVSEDEMPDSLGQQGIVRLIMNYQFSLRRLCGVIVGNLFVIGLFSFVALAPCPSLAQDKAVDPAASEANEVVAVIEGVEIRRQAVINRAPQLNGFQLSEQQKKKIDDAILQRIIDAHVVHRYLESFGKLVSESEFKLQLGAVEAELAKYEKTLEAHVADKRQTLDEFKFDFAMQLSWKAYLREKLSEENLSLHYDRNRRKFDGTDVRVAHVFLAVADSSNLEPQRVKANEIHAALEKEEITWADAVENHSEGSKRNQGEIGFVLKANAMPPEFTSAALSLDAGQISQPVKTQLGFHIIKCLEVVPGSVGWRDAEKAVAKDAERFLFRTIVDSYRDKVKVEIK